MADHPKASSAHDGSQRSGRNNAHGRRLWPWFAAGFLLVFVGMSFGITMHTMLPSGDGVVECRLWRYYIVEIRRAAGPTTLGPAAGGSSVAETAVFHVLLSVVGGAVLTGIGWGVRKVRG